MARPLNSSAVLQNYLLTLLYTKNKSLFTLLPFSLLYNVTTRIEHLHGFGHPPSPSLSSSLSLVVSLSLSMSSCLSFSWSKVSATSTPSLYPGRATFPPFPQPAVPPHATAPPTTLSPYPGSSTLTDPQMPAPTVYTYSPLHL